MAMLGVRRLAEEEFEGDGAARLLAGNALHADLSPESPLGGFYGWFLCGLGQSVGFPFPEGGAQRLTDALVARLRAQGGELTCDARVERVLVRRGRAVGVRTADGTVVEARHAVLADTMPGALYERLLEPEHVPARIRDDLRRLQLDPATVKVDWALDGPDPLARRGGPPRGRRPRRRLRRRADAVHRRARAGPDPGEAVPRLRPVRARRRRRPDALPRGKEVAWAYTHVPQAIRGDAAGELTGSWDDDEVERFVERIEARVEALAPGFRSLVRARHVLTPRELEARDENLVGGALNGGTAQLHQQLFFRPTPGLGRPETPVARLYLASAAAHPGGGVHGGPGVIAARAALHADRTRRIGLLVGAAAALAVRRRS